MYATVSVSRGRSRMRMKYRAQIRLICVLVAGLVAIGSAYADTEDTDIQVLLQQLQNDPHTQEVDLAEQDVVDHEVGLGAIQKVRGEWQFKDSERLTGTLFRYTWLIENGFSSAEVMESFLSSVAKIEGSNELFACDGRACGRAVQWANRVFSQRLLFGQEGLQRYRVYALPSEQGGDGSRILAYSAERTADRQYLHVEWLVIAPQQRVRG